MYLQTNVKRAHLEIYELKAIQRTFKPVCRNTETNPQTLVTEIYPLNLNKYICIQA